MFGIGFTELVLLSLIGLIVLGPEKLPRVANQLGSWLGQARRMTRVMKRQLEDEINIEQDFSIKPPSREPSKQPTTGVPSEDDHHSAAHDADAPGSGVGDTEYHEDDYESGDDLAVSTAERNDEPADAEALLAEELATENRPADSDLDPVASDADAPQEKDRKEAS